WTGSLSVVVPLGTYETSKTINVSLNRYAIDPTVGVTWLNPQTGLEVSGALGYTVSFENDKTDYDSGDEVHVEAAVAQHFPSGLALGLAGYGVWQVTGDSGTGAVLGDFKGRAIGLGPMASYNFDVAGYKLSANARYYHEFAVAKRFEGDTGFLQVSFKF
ncbi:SphA family protein, partial [Skermanella aerolata]